MEIKWHNTPILHTDNGRVWYDREQGVWWFANMETNTCEGFLNLGVTNDGDVDHIDTIRNSVMDTFLHREAVKEIYLVDLDKVNMPTFLSFGYECIKLKPNPSKEA